MTLASDLINLALTDSGVLGQGQSASAQDQSDCLRRANQMLSQWSKRRWLVWHLVETSLVCTGAQSYTVGAGGNFNITRPDRIEFAFLRQVAPSTPTPVDFPLRQIQSREEYSALNLKGLVASPSDRFFYDSAYPLGAIYPWPIPSASFELHILTKDVFQQFAALTDTLTLPPEYEEAIYYNLMVRLRIAYRLPADREVNAMARAALNTIRKANFQIGVLSMPRSLRSRWATYNVYSDSPN